MRVVFRADASTAIGTGHVMRCLTLASALRSQGAEILFVCREHAGNLCDVIQTQGFELARIPLEEPATSSELSLYAHWLGASWQRDADATDSAIVAWNGMSDLLVVDHYALDARWEQRLKNIVRHLMVIDDLADRRHECDFLLDQNLVDGMNSRYLDKVPAKCVVMLGPAYALLQPIYTILHNKIPPRTSPVRRILVSFGGVDTDNLTGSALEALIQLQRSDIEIDVVISSLSPNEKAVRALASSHQNVRVHGALATLAPLIAGADLAIGASGATTWERLCLGLPSLVITAAENQKAIAECLEERGLICLSSKKEIGAALHTALENPEIEAWSKRCANIVDGKGVERVCEILTTSATTPVHARYATLDDEDLLLAWANDPETRRSGFSSELIKPDTHRAWFTRQLQNAGCRFLILETQNRTALGQVRFERHLQDWEVHYSVAPFFRGRGLGRVLLSGALDELRRDQTGALVFGRVKPDNQASRRIFESLGFDSDMDPSQSFMTFRRRI